MVRIEKTYLALLDILGFKKLSENNSHEELEEIYTIWIRGIKNELESHYVELQKYIPLNLRLSHVSLEAKITSDSILLWTNDTSYANFFSLLITVRFMLLNGILCGIPSRGAITCGPLSTLKEAISSPLLTIDTLFGKTLTEAHELGNSISMAGCVISEDSLEEYRVRAFGGMLQSSDYSKLQDAISIEALEKRYFLKTYPVKVKNPSGQEDKKTMTTVNWVSAMTPKIQSSFLPQSFGMRNKDVSSDRVKKIIQNTVEYVESLPAEMYTGIV